MQGRRASKAELAQLEASLSSALERVSAITACGKRVGRALKALRKDNSGLEAALTKMEDHVGRRQDAIFNTLSEIMNLSITGGDGEVNRTVPASTNDEDDGDHSESDGDEDNQQEAGSTARDDDADAGANGVGHESAATRADGSKAEKKKKKKKKKKQSKQKQKTAGKKRDKAGSISRKQSAAARSSSLRKNTAQLTRAVSVSQLMGTELGGMKRLQRRQQRPRTKKTLTKGSVAKRLQAHHARHTKLSVWCSKK